MRTPEVLKVRQGAGDEYCFNYSVNNMAQPCNRGEVQNFHMFEGRQQTFLFEGGA